MSETRSERPRRMAILARHGRTLANAIREMGMTDYPLQGFSKAIPLDEVGERQSRAFGAALSRFVKAHDARIATIYCSDAVRTVRTRDMALEVAVLQPAPAMSESDIRLRELCKGDLEGVNRSRAYPTPEIVALQSNHWHFRHGSMGSGGETAFEAGGRWLEWFHHAVDALPADGGPSIPTLIAFGHDHVTAYGLWMLTHQEVDPASLTDAKVLKSGNGTAIVVVETHRGWSVLPERIVPEDVDFLD